MMYSGEWTIRSKDHSILFTVHYVVVIDQLRRLVCSIEVLFIDKTVVMIRFCVSPKGILSTPGPGSIKATIGLLSD